MFKMSQVSISWSQKNIAQNAMCAFYAMLYPWAGLPVDDLHLVCLTIWRRSFLPGTSVTSHERHGVAFQNTLLGY